MQSPCACRSVPQLRRARRNTGGGRERRNAKGRNAENTVPRDLADRPWGDAPRTNKLVFIGRNLDRQALSDGFRACLA